MVILIDTNIALDFLTMNQSYYDDARDIIRICSDEQIQSYIAYNSLPNIFCILSKSHSEIDGKKMLKNCIFDVKAITPKEFLDIVETR